VRQARWAPRTLDLDLIAYDDLILPDRATYKKWAELPLEEQMTLTPRELILPHPRLAERAFVLVPLAEVAGDWVHPVTGRTVRQMLDELPHKDISEVAAL
jgi:2-amino-4-hydroxy-6-hydroxymethyldihydropteridine diphosphokinase